MHLNNSFTKGDQVQTEHSMRAIHIYIERDDYITRHKKEETEIIIRVYRVHSHHSWVVPCIVRCFTVFKGEDLITYVCSGTIRTVYEKRLLVDN